MQGPRTGRPQDGPREREDYSELKVIKARQLERTVCPSLNFREESTLGVFPRRRVISRDKFYLNDPPGQQGNHLITRLSTLLMPWEVNFFPLKPQTPDPVSLGRNNLFEGELQPPAF